MGDLLNHMDYSLRSTRKTHEGGQHKDRKATHRYTRGGSIINQIEITG
ncbi:MAG: hypothetical protein HGA59_04700 [Chlorobiaceae bacterium]|nr:hypothetical protein [Chlorobiaceae bacterium]